MNWAAVNWEAFANGLLIVVVGLLSALGLRGGKKAADKPKDETMQVLGAVIDNRKADELVRSIKDQTEAIKRNTETLRDMNRNMDETQRDMRDLCQALWRRPQ